MILSEVRYETTPPVGIVEHEYARLFPMLEGEASARLIEDIREHGVLEPIVFLGSAILDGRNRYYSARQLKIAYPRVDYLGNDPLGFVISRNLHRRHLSDQKRASIAADIAKLGQGARTDLPAIEGRLPSQEQAADMLNVSVAAVERAAAVKKHGAPELIAAVEAETISLSAAAEVAALPVEQQAEIVAAGPAATAEAAKAQREKRKSERRAKQAENDRYRDAAQEALPQAVKDRDAAKASAIAERKARTEEVAAAAELDELREANAALEAENASLKAEIKRFEEMRVQWEQGGFEAVIAGKDEEIRVLLTRVERESGDKAAHSRSAAFWKDQAIKLGYSRDAVLDLSTGEFVDG